MRNPGGTGWLARQQAAKAALAAHEAGLHPVASTDIGRERAAMIQAQADADKAAREAADAKITNTVSVCPCCKGKGYAAVSDAAKVVEAVRRYDFVGWKPDTATIAELMKSAIVVDRDGKPITETVETLPLVEDGAEDHAETVEEAVNALETKPKRGR